MEKGKKIEVESEKGSSVAKAESSGSQVVGTVIAKDKDKDGKVEDPFSEAAPPDRRPMEFKDEAVSQEHRFAIGTESVTGKRYLSIPTTNGTMDYEEYYELTEDEFKRFRKDMSKGAAFAQGAREREHEAALIVKPGRERGWAQ